MSEGGSRELAVGVTEGLPVESLPSLPLVGSASRPLPWFCRGTWVATVVDASPTATVPTDD